MPILSHLLLSAEKDGVCIQATDLEIGTRGFYPANVVAEGAVALNARKLFDITRELPDQEIHLKREDNDWVTLKCGKSKFRLPGLPAKDFPALPEYSEDSIMEFSSVLLREMIRKTFFAVSPDETRQALNGLLLEKENDRANLVGTDGHRLALINRPLLKSNVEGDEALSYLLPKKALTELLKLMDADDQAFQFSAKNNHLAFIQGRQVIVSRKIDGKFPNYRQVIPADNKLQVRANRDDLIHALKRVALLADEKSKMVRFEIQKGLLTLVSDNTELGAAREEMSVNYDGEDVVVNLKDQNHSCMITVAGDKDYLSIVMPMRL